MQPLIRVHSGLFEPPAARYAAAIDWLRMRGVESKHIADAFKLLPGNVRTIRSRWQTSSTWLPGPASPALARFAEESTRKPYIQIPSAELCDELGISPRHDYVLIRPAEERELDSLEAEIDATWSRYARENRFADGFWKIRGYIPRLGHPRSVRRIRILAQLRHHSAWFLVHSGQARSALDQATRAIALSLKAYAESDDDSDLARVAESALIAAMACQLRNQPQSSRKMLDLAKAAGQSSAQTESPEYFRQCGVVCLQLGEDDQAQREFQAAMARARDASDVTLATVEMMGARQTHLLGIPDWDRAQEFLANVTRVFPEGTLQYSVNANWTAATGIAIGSANAAADAMELLERAERTAKRFGHQATIHHLLCATPRLKLPPKLLQSWLRFALYFDAFRDE